MSLIPRVNLPLRPPRETRHTPDQTEIVSEVADQSPVVTPSEVKEFIPLNHDQYDFTVDRLIKSVTRQVESFIRRDLIQKKVKSYWQRVPQKAVLSRGPHVSVDKVVVRDHSGEEHELTEGDNYRVEGMQYLSIVSIDMAGELFVEYTSGYEPEKRPPEVGGAILQEISLQFKNRQDPDSPAMTSVNNLSLEARHLLSSLIRRGI